jgi:hypothetical protein
VDVPVMALTLVVPFDPLKQLVFVDTKTGVNELGAITKTVPDAAQTGVVAFKVYTPGAALTKVVLVFVDENEFGPVQAKERGVAVRPSVAPRERLVVKPAPEQLLVANAVKEHTQLILNV